MTREEYLEKATIMIAPLKARVTAKIGEEKASLLCEYVSKKGESFMETYSLMGWKTVGQSIVYGDEKVLGFSGAANVCGLVERDVKAARKRKMLDAEMFKAIYSLRYLDTLCNVKGF
jgi:uncharacterized protein (DUF169 family)